MNAFDSSLTHALGITFLGVHFYWPSRKPGFNRDNLEAFDESYHNILEVVGESVSDRTNLLPVLDLSRLHVGREKCTG